MFREYRLGAQSPKWDDFTSSKLRDLCRHGETGGASGDGWLQHSRTEAHVETHRPWQHTRPAQVQARRAPSTKRGIGPWSYVQLIPTGKEKKSVFSNGVSLGISPGQAPQLLAFLCGLFCFVLLCFVLLVFCLFIWRFGEFFCFLKEKTKLDG